MPIKANARFKLRIAPVCLALLLTLLVTACVPENPCNHVTTIAGNSGDKTTGPFTIERVGEIELMHGSGFTIGGLDLKLYDVSNDAEPVWQDNWGSTGDKHIGIAAGTYYLFIHMDDVMFPNALISQGYYIEVRDCPD